MRKYIETALPLTEINEAAMREKAGKPGHPANLHMWWGRSPEASSLAAPVSYTHLDVYKRQSLSRLLTSRT